MSLKKWKHGNRLSKIDSTLIQTMCPCTITISEEAYQRLLSLKQKDETWSDTIMRITKKKPLSEVAGIISEKDADEIEKNINKLREKSREKLQSQIGMIPGAPPEISKDEIWKELNKKKNLLDFQ